MEWRNNTPQRLLFIASFIAPYYCTNPAQRIAIMLKPLFRTLILASILFFLLVYLGLKYHWGDAIKNTKKVQEQAELTIPVEESTEEPTEETPLVDSMQDSTEDPTDDSAIPIIDVPPFDADETEISDDDMDQSNPDDEAYQPEIIKNGPAIALIDSMTKDQVALQCQHLYNSSFDMANDPNIELLIGNCVVSNFQEPFEEIPKTPQMLQQEQRIKQRAISNCQYQILQPDNSYLSNIEKQLLVGICVSNQINQSTDSK